MARYIDIDIVIKKFKKAVSKVKPDKIAKDIIYDIIELLQNEPTADVVEVVRCKDCNHGHWNQETCHGKPIYYCDRTNLQVSKYSFCSYGERRNKNDG